MTEVPKTCSNNVPVALPSLCLAALVCRLVTIFMLYLTPADPCNDAAFVEDYNSCLQCAGPDNFNIWRYYGATLSTAGARCGFSTEPESGVAPTSAAPTSAAAEETSAAAQSSTAAASSAPAPSSAAAPATSEAAATTEAATSEAPVSSAATPSAATSDAATSDAATFAAVTSSALHPTVITHAVSSAPYYPTAIANGTLSYSVSGVPSPSSNASASFTSVSALPLSSPNVS